VRILNNIPLSGKVLGLVGIVTATAAALLAYLSLSIGGATEQYRVIATERSPGYVALARAQRHFQLVGKHLNRMIIEFPNRAAVERAWREVEFEIGNFHTRNNQFEAGDPSQKATAEANRVLHRELEQRARDLRNALLEQGNRELALSIVRGDIDRLIDSLRDRLVEQVNSNVSRQTAMSASAKDQIDTALERATVALAICVALIMVVSFVLIRTTVSLPLRGLMASLQRVSDGDLNVPVVGAERKDELGDVARMIDAFKASAAERLRLEASQEQFKQAAEMERRDAIAALAAGFEASVNKVVDTVSTSADEMLASAKDLTAAIGRAAVRAEDAATASEGAKQSVGSVASASAAISETLEQVSVQVESAATLAQKASHEAADTSSKVAKLADSASMIGEVIKLISAIAEQTNLLALNATIEAARAGEAGRGFAVVAAEVKSLASQTANATEQIADQITRMQSDTSAVVGAIESIGKIIETLNNSAGSIAVAVQEQHQATREIARSTALALTGASEVATNVADVSGAATDAGNSSASVLAAAERLNGQSDLLKSEVVGFLARVRAP